MDDSTESEESSLDERDAEGKGNHDNVPEEDCISQLSQARCHSGFRQMIQR